MSLGHQPVEQMLVVTAPDDELSKLQEQLYQALTREAEAYKKVKHLHEQLLETQSALSLARTTNGLHYNMESPDLVSGDTDLSQNSEVSPQSPTPALIVIGTPETKRISRARSISQPASPNTRRGLNQSNHIISDEAHPNEQVHPKPMNGSVPNDSMPRVWSLESNTSPTFTLAPTSRQLSNVRVEREKPPPASTHHRRSASLHSISKTSGGRVSSAPLTKRQTSPDPIVVSPSEGQVLSPEAEYARLSEKTSPQPKKPVTGTASLSRIESERLSKSSVNGTTSLSRIESERASKAMNGSASLSRLESERVPKKTRSGPRGRSNSTISGWLRKRIKSKPDRSLNTEKTQSESFTIEQIFQSFASLPTTNHRDPLAKYIDRPWTDVCVSGDYSREDVQYRNAVWDLFQEETKYLTNLLQPLELVYKGFLDELHFHGILKIADVDKIFANLSELCELSSSVANDLFQLFSCRSGDKIAPNGELISAFSMFGHKFNPVYQRFCVNFEKQRGFVRALQQLPEFREYLLVCRTHEIVQKKDLSDLLITPMQHQCHYQLLLEKVLKYTKDPSEKAVLGSAIKAFVVSLKELEGNIDENKRSAELLELQETLSWPSVAQLDTDAYIPEEIQGSLRTQPSSELLASKDRQLIYKGTLRLLDSKAKPGQELHTFLFTDILLFTELKSNKKEGNQLIRYQVFGHPLFLDRFEIHKVPYSSTHKHIITLVENTVLQQKVKVYSLQTTTKNEKDKWVSQIQHTQELLWHRQNDRSFLESDV